MKSLKARDGKMVVIDPRRTGTANIADEFYFIRPGTDALLLMAMVGMLLEEDLVELGHAENWTRDVDLIRLASRSFKPEAVSAHTGLAADDIRGLVRQLATTRKAAIYTRMGTSTQAFGAVATWLAYVLNILTGKLDTAGGMMFTQPAVDTMALGAMAGPRPDPRLCDNRRQPGTFQPQRRAAR